MGEAKRKREKMTPYEIEMQKLQRDLADKGRVIEAGWVALRALAIPQEASEQQVQDMRAAYMSGAQHLFASIMGILDPGEEPTDADLRRMDLIDKELRDFAREWELRFHKAKGSA
ncbi:hypothetical protein [Microvirga massiliensis]|uniref:hypothetical protein n=1 Tax=Microvirga massiliensis TaxID=1033741 RepID=UPI00062BB017|nr:hypothetical protein [Microvirga massiliensis]